MRTGLDKTPKDDDYLLPNSPPTNPITLPTPPSPTHPKPLSKSKSHTTTLSITTSFPSPPASHPSLAMQPLPATVLSPDEMLRAYAARKKNLADAARLSAYAASASPGAGVVSGNIPGVQTVSSIHATGMRVAYHTDVTPTRTSDDSSPSPAPASTMKHNPFVSSSLHISTPSGSDRARYAIGDVEDDQGQQGEVEDEDAYDYAYAYSYGAPQDIGMGDGGENADAQAQAVTEVDVGFAGRGAYGYHQNQHLA